MEFAIVCCLLFTCLLGVIELSRAMMVLNALANAARNGARAGAVTTGNYTAIVNTVNTSLSNATISASPTITVTVSGTPVSDDTTFTSTAVAGTTISVQVSVPYSAVSWLPAKVTVFLASGQVLSEAALMVKEG
jgi:Flp pilus assembly protein TadG